jgi:MarR-like DNA-binding transcriptional regulator SgrR of sgrS sRNA
MLNLIFSGLTGFDKENKLIPMLASSWKHKGIGMRYIRLFPNKKSCPHGI